MELLERAAAAGGRLLRVERLAGSAGDELASAAFLLTFDVGRLLVSADASGNQLNIMHFEQRDDLPSGLVLADEDEPWWRLLGNSLTQVKAGEDPRNSVRLQFRKEDDNPRSITLVREGEVVRIRMG